ncbi:hypothetical protein U9M48_034528 [Paspalum notatum var. saurae]|uniref:protein-serine/threonine phosphatase n=1 Tax=Paspalum notatum var. saurae TaxID=547442 RepID=A0AAQ3X7I2_PASNO
MLLGAWRQQRSCSASNNGDLLRQGGGGRWRPRRRRRRGGFPFHHHLWTVSMHTKQGCKGANQDAMTVCQDFAGHKGHIFCGVFDGHGPLGREVARHVRDTLPMKQSSALRPKTEEEDPANDTSLKLTRTVQDHSSDDSKLETEEDHSSDDSKPQTEEVPSSNSADLDSFDKSDSSSSSDTSDENQLLSTWKSIFTKTFEEVDAELKQHSGIDCICSGTTAVTVVRQGDHLFIANLGDSRAVLCTQDSKGRLIPIQLTTDLKPDLPSELARILNCKGRVFAMDDEPDVPRLWLPDQDAPGLAMARAFGDFCLKNHGLICTPEVYYRKLTEKDEFLVLATDGIWDVLSNKAVVKMVSSATDPSKAARQLIDRAVRAWRRKYPTSMVDDCAVVCLFLNRAGSPDEATAGGGAVKPPPPAAVSSYTGSFRRNKALTGGGGGEAPEEGPAAWRALEGVARANSLIRLPRIGRVLSWRRRSTTLDDDEDDDQD